MKCTGDEWRRGKCRDRNVKIFIIRFVWDKTAFLSHAALVRFAEKLVIQNDCLLIVGDLQ